MKVELTTDQIIELIRVKIVNEYGTQQAYAEAFGLTPQAISRILTKECLPTNRLVLRSIGLKLESIEKMFICESIIQAEPTEGVAA